MKHPLTQGETRQSFQEQVDTTKWVQSKSATMHDTVLHSQLKNKWEQNKSAMIPVW